MQPYPRGLNLLQKISMSLMAGLVLLTFVGANLHALMWQSSEWLVSTVLPAVVVDLTNDERADLAALPLQRSATLDEAARLKAEHMAKNEYFSHFSPDGVSPWHWFDETGYVYAHAGENLAIHFTDSDEVVAAWMDSPTHRANIVSGLYSEIGVGTAKGTYEGYDTVYVVQLFGAPAVRPVPATESPEPPVVTEVVPTASPLLVDTVSVAEPVPTLTESKPAATVVVVDPVVPPVLTSAEPVEKLVQPVSVPTPVTKPVVSLVDEVVVIESPVIATSSGLAVAHITVPQEKHAGATVASIATRPNALLQTTYFILGSLILLLLLVSVAQEARRFHFAQVAYGLALMAVMGGLWYTHSILTTGAVIV